MEKFAIFDYSTSTVHIYDLERDAPITDEYLEDLGFNSNDCYWMAGNIEIAIHNEVLK